MKQLKRANGTGSVYKLSGRRTRPYVAMVTTYYSTNYDGSKTKRLQKRTPLGYFRTRDEAMLALLEYNRNPYELTENALHLPSFMTPGVQNTIKAYLPQP